ncbi:hypothetical protein [Croceiramulus getboli]|nr:hypothetical protein P8624_11300 [Flavobacteriaceae bacterium YJPT1-3]
MKLVIQLLLWIVIGVLGYFLFMSVYGEVQFNKIKEKRYQKAIKNLKDIRVAELAYKDITGEFTGDFDKLVRFIDTAQFTITQKRDTVIRDEEQSRRFGVDMMKEIVLTDTLGYASVKDSLFGDSDRYKTMMNVPIEGADAQFELQAGTIEKNDYKVPVFEARVAKDVLLYDQPKDYVRKEKDVVSVDGVNGPYLSVGSMTEVKDVGNWPKSYGANDQ